MNVLSLFDGISCARVALERAGIKVDNYYASEIDKYAIQVSQKNWPDIIQLGDVKNVYGRECGLINDTGIKDESGTLIKIDLLIGGSPCQDLSIAKKDRKGLLGERSGLFWEYVRILNEVKPKYFILENVNSMPKEAKEIITKTLGVQLIMINAALVSAQSRKRLFWTNIPNIVLPEDKGIFMKDIIHENRNEKFDLEKYIIKTDFYRKKGLDYKFHGEKDSKAQALRASDYKVTHNIIAIEKLKSNTLRSGGKGSGINDKHNWDTIRVAELNSGGQSDRIYSTEGKSVCLLANGGGRGAKTGLYRIKNKYDRKITPIECERLQCVPDNYTVGISNSQRYKCLGNAFNADVVAHILSFIK